eukprot:462005_1
MVMPSLFDNNGFLDYAQNKDIPVCTAEYFFSQLKDQIQTCLTNEEGIDRPVIVLFKDETALNKFYNSECCKEWRINHRVQLLTHDLSENKNKTGILNATKPNVITFATKEYGRGID